MANIFFLLILKLFSSPAPLIPTFCPYFEEGGKGNGGRGEGEEGGEGERGEGGRRGVDGFSKIDTQPPPDEWVHMRQPRRK